MYIRRKVFSNIQVNENEVKTFSTTEYELDENLQARLFSEKEDKEKEEDDKKAKAKKAAKVAGIAGGGAGVGVGGSYLVGKALKNAGDKEFLKAKNAEQYAKALKKADAGLALQAPGKAVAEFVKNPVISSKRGAKAAAEGAKKAGESVKSGAKYTSKATRVLTSKEGRRILKAVKKAKK